MPKPGRIRIGRELNYIVFWLRFIEGSSIRQNDPFSILVAEDVANPPGEDTPFISLTQGVKVRYSFVDPQTGKSEEETKNFVVSGTIDWQSHNR
jgi:putative ABC transport system permease protein